MKAIMVMFDSLNRHMLPPYGCDWVHAPNFSRLAQRTLVFDNSYICSMPCMPAHMRDMFEPGELEGAELASPFAFTKGCPLLKVPRRTDADFPGAGSLLFDLENDPGQKQPLHDAAQERRLAGRMVELMRECSAPLEQFERLGLAC